MTHIPTEGSSAKSHYKSTAELYPTSSQELLAEVDAFRRRYELLHGPTDTRREYITQAPQAVQTWLLNNRPRQYVEAMPPFLLAFLSKRWEQYAQQDRLDDLPAAMLICHLSLKGRLR